MNKLTFPIISAAVFFMLFGCSQKQKKQSMLSQQIDSLLSMESGKPFNGIILIERNGETAYLKMAGFSDMEKKTPLTIDDQFVVGSISKQFTTAVVLQEYDKGRIDLTEPIKTYLPYLTEKWADTVTVHHLLSHTHGIVELDKPTPFPVGTDYNYSQIGFDLLAKIAEKTSGKPFSQLSAELFEECHMSETFHPEIKDYKHLVKGYMENEEGILEFTDESLKYYPAAGAFISSAQDLAKWNRCFFGGKILNQNTFKLMTTAQDKAVRNHPVFGVTKYGYGITVEDEDGIIQWGQTGFAPGFVCMNFYFPQENTSVIVLENVAYDTSELKKTFYFHSRILDLVKNQLKQMK